MTQQEIFSGRDKRERGWFWLDNEYLNGYAKYFGPVGTAIYVALCRHSDNKTQKCFPAIITLAEELGTTENTIKKYIKLFEKYKIVSVKREKDSKTKRRKPNVYTLLDKKYWIKPKKPQHKSHRQSVPVEKPEATIDESRRQPLPNKETKYKEDSYSNEDVAGKINHKKIVKIIDAFNWNPASKRWYGNKTQRTAIEDLLKLQELESLIKFIEILPEMNKKKYFPTTTTPHQLLNNFSRIQSFFEKQKSNNNKIAFI